MLSYNLINPPNSFIDLRLLVTVGLNKNGVLDAFLTEFSAGFDSKLENEDVAGIILTAFEAVVFVNDNAFVTDPVLLAVLNWNDVDAGWEITNDVNTCVAVLLLALNENGVADNRTIGDALEKLFGDCSCCCELFTMVKGIWAVTEFELITVPKVLPFRVLSVQKKNINLSLLV